MLQKYTTNRCAFGSSIAEIGFSKDTGNKYRYSFNGKESDEETGLQDYGFRIYNPSLGKFLSEDPLSKDYPELTPYQFASNTPIKAIDLDGLEAVLPAAPPPVAMLTPPISNAPNATVPQSCNSGCLNPDPITANQQLVMWDYFGVRSSSYTDANGNNLFSLYFKRYRTYNVSAEVNQRLQISANGQNNGNGIIVGEEKRNCSQGWLISYVGREPLPATTTNTITTNTSVNQFTGITNQPAGAVAATNRAIIVPIYNVNTAITNITFTYNTNVVQNGFTITNLTTGALVTSIPAVTTAGPIAVNIPLSKINPGDNLSINNTPVPVAGQGDQMNYNLSITQTTTNPTVTTITPGANSFTNGVMNPAAAPVINNVNINTPPVINNNATFGR